MKPLDWFAPVGLCVAGAGLCIWGAVVSSGAAVAVCIAVACILCLIAGAFVVMRAGARMPDFSLGRPGVDVIVGKSNRPTLGQVVGWVKRVQQHWVAREIRGVPITVASLDAALSGVTLFYLDAERLTSWGRAVRGFTQGKDCAIGNTAGAIESLTVHELSHVVLAAHGVEWNERLHHDYFGATRLGA